MDKQLQFRLRQTVNEMYFKKSLLKNPSKSSLRSVGIL